jgi:hypothetical protein
VFLGNLIGFLRFISHANIFFKVQHPFLRLNSPTAPFSATVIFLKKYITLLKMTENAALFP